MKGLFWLISLVTCKTISGLLVHSKGHRWSRLAHHYVTNENIPGDVPQKIKSPSLQELFGTRQVSLLGTSSMESSESTSPLIFKEDPTLPGDVIEIPLMPFPTALFPGARELLYIYEMRFRTLMNDAEEKGRILGRCFITDEGAVGKIGCRCNIIEQRRLEDGKGFFIIESMERFRILRITKRTPYLTAEVQVIDDELESDEQTAINDVLCQEVYALLKTYLRLARLRAVGTTTSTSGDQKGGREYSIDVKDGMDARVESIAVSYGGYDTYDGEDVTGGDFTSDDFYEWAEYNGAERDSFGDDECDKDDDGEKEGDEEEGDPEDIRLSPAVRDSAPLSISSRDRESDGGRQRHKRFSYAVGDLLSTDPAIMQIMLQETSTAFRLHGLKRILIEAVAELGTSLVDEGMTDQRGFDRIREKGENVDDDATDLMPDPSFTGMSLQSELSKELVAQLGLSTGDQLVAAWVNERVLREGFLAGDEDESSSDGDVAAATGRSDSMFNSDDNASTVEGMTGSGVVENDDDAGDIWNGAGAFQ